MNLLTETKEEIEEIGKTPEDIIFIGSESGYSCTWDEFMVLADEEYDDDYGSAEVATDLKIVFNDQTFLSRREYDGAEWWVYNRPVKIPSDTKPIKRLMSSELLLSDLELLNSERKKK